MSDLVETLRDLDRAEYPGRGGRLDPALVVRAGRRRRAVHRASTAAGAGALVVALALAVPTVLGGHRAPGPAQHGPAATASTAPPSSPQPSSPGPSPTSDPATTAPSPGPGVEPDPAAPDPVVLGPGIVAASGVSGALGPMTGDDGVVGTAYSVGGWDDTAVRIGVGLPESPTLSVWAIRGEAVSVTPPDSSPQVLAESAVTAWSEFDYSRDGTFLAGITPPGAPRAFYVAVGAFSMADGSQRHAFEIPTFAPPSAAAPHLTADQRMYVLAWSEPAVETLFSTTSGVVFATADGVLVDPECADQTAEQCAPYFDESGALDEVRALLAAG